VPNLNSPDFDDDRDAPGFVARRARVGRQGGAVRTGLSLWELPPGQAAYPYHFHYTEEEIVVVLEGRPHLRDSSGWRQLDEGEVVAFLAGERGVHQIVNRTDETVRFLAFSTSGDPDIVVQPDAHKIGVFERLPEGRGLRQWFFEKDEVGYWEDVPPPELGS
jgi:uncharacterized cupin superfamily protein